MPHYYFDIKDGHRLVDPSGLNFKTDDDAIRKARLLAIGVSLDKPAVDPKRHIAVLNGSREEIFRVPIYSKPSMMLRKINRLRARSLKADGRCGWKEVEESTPHMELTCRPGLSCWSACFQPNARASIGVHHEHFLHHRRDRSRSLYRWLFRAARLNQKVDPA
jgi:hypothetical protein